MEIRDFKGVWIPKEIWLNKELSAVDKCILTEISSLDNENHCTASNEYLAEFCGVSVSTVTRTIKKLKEMNLIETEMVTSNTGSYRIIKLSKANGSNQNDETGLIKMIDNYNSNNINNKVLSKDNTSEFDFGGCLESKPKNSLYKKCLALIDDFTDLPEIRKALIEFLNYRLEIKDKPFYVNQFKGMLKALDKAVEETYKYNKDVTYVDVIEYAIQRGWLNFYPIPEKQPYSKQSTPDSNKAKQQKFDVVSDKTATNNDGTQMIF